MSEGFLREGVASWVPTILALVVMLVLHGAVQLFDPATPVPDIALQLVVFWGWYRPSWLPAWGVLMLGVVQDSLTGFPLGLHAAVLLCTQLAMRSRVRHVAEQRFAVQWLVMAVIVAGVMVLRGAAFEIYASVSYVSWRMAQGWAMTVLTYPCMHWACGGLYRLWRGPAGSRG